MEERQARVERITIPRPKGITLPLFSQGTPGFFHLLDYGWSEGRPHLMIEKLEDSHGELIPSGEVSDLDPIGSETLEMTLSREAYCVGRWVGGKHMPCPYLSRVVGESQCERCLLEDIPDPSCIFEPHCWQDPCGAHFCQAEHVVYLAIFGDRIKVGMTQNRRIEMRAIEQGADGILPLMLLGDRYSARTVERSVSSILGIPQSIHTSVQIESMMRAPSGEELESDLLSTREKVLDHWGDIVSMTSTYPGEVQVLKDPNDLDISIYYPEYPLPTPLPHIPKRNKGNIIRGEVVGAKGRFLILISNSLIAHKMNEMIGKIALVNE